MSNSGKSVKMLVAGLAVAALSASVYAHDDEDHCGKSKHGWSENSWTDMDSDKMEKMRDEHLAKLHDKLKLTAKQEPAWKTFTDNKLVIDKKARPDPAEMDKLNAPQRMEKGLEHMRTMETKLADRLKSLKEFYAVLTPEQQKIFDEEIARHEKHGHRHSK